MASANSGDVPLDNLSPSGTASGAGLPTAPSEVPENSSDSSGITAVSSPPPSSTGAIFPQVPTPQPRRRRPLPSEAAAALADEPHPAARYRSNATRSTRYILLHFAGSAPRYVTPEEQARREEWEARRERALAALERLAEPTKRSQISHLWRLTTNSETLRRHHEPADYDALEACSFWFPQLGNVPIHVCDFRADGGSRYVSTLSNIEDYLDEKPRDVQVRWIHVPLGKGILQSTVEDVFRYTGSGEIGKPFYKGSPDPSWNYPELAMLHFANHERYLQKMDAFRILSEQIVLANGISTSTGSDGSLDSHKIPYCLHSLSDRLTRDVMWRADHVGLPINFWDMTKSMLPNPLPERFLGQASCTNLKGALPTENDRQAICGHPQFENSMLMSSQLRAFHRSDGFVLTFANQTGVDYLGQPFRGWLNQPDQFMADSDVSVLAHIAENFIASGTSKWHYRTVEWLVVYILTEAAVVPHNIRQGRNSTSLLTAYQDIARDLKQRQKRPWERGESPRLVRRYLNCLEELRAISDLAAQKLEVLNGMVIDAERFEAEYEAEGVPANLDDDETETMKERIEWAIGMVDEQRRDAAFLVDYFHTALNELFQLRSIEQNEMAIVAESQNKAVLLFTGVTIVFLPLSFFTSYFGMNLRGIAETDKDEAYFWGVCGSIAFLIVFVLVGYAFRQDFARKMSSEWRVTGWRPMTKVKGS